MEKRKEAITAAMSIPSLMTLPSWVQEMRVFSWPDTCYLTQIRKSSCWIPLQNFLDPDKNSGNQPSRSLDSICPGCWILEEYLLREHFLKCTLRFYWKSAGSSNCSYEEYSSCYIKIPSNIAGYQVNRNTLAGCIS